MRGPEAVALAREWFHHAREDLEAARALASSPALVPRHACWWAQRAAEKAIKSLLVLDQVEFPFVHDLDALRRLVSPRHGIHRADPDLASLSRWAVAARYPGQPGASEADAHEAVELASRVVELVEADFEREAVA